MIDSSFNALGQVETRQETAWRRLRMSESSGRLLGSDAWLAALETRTGRILRPQKRGRKPRQYVTDEPKLV